ncbi:MAG TPA: hypothetical protein VFI47_22280, partial [Acidimicrobiales bacterium]|nr:hypothetical protein [Acidimicrobiales bacterium]
MGLFRRRRVSDPSPPGGATPAPPAAGGAGATVQREAVSAPPAWATLPPLTPTVGPPASTFKIGAAVKPDLVALDSPRLTTGMAHLVSADGPPGVVSGLATVGVQRAAIDAGSLSPVEIPLAPGAEPADGADRAPAGDAPAGGPALLVPRVVTGDTWGPPASPTAAPPVVEAAPTRHLPLVLPPAP